MSRFPHPGPLTHPSAHEAGALLARQGFLRLDATTVARFAGVETQEIGRASCRERV